MVAQPNLWIGAIATAIDCNGRGWGRFAGIDVLVANFGNEHQPGLFPTLSRDDQKNIPGYGAHPNQLPPR